MVASGEEAGSARTAQRRRVEVAVTHSVLGEFVQVRRLAHGGSIATEGRVADIVEDDVENIGCSLWSGGEGRPIRGRCVDRLADRSLERRWIRRRHDDAAFKCSWRREDALGLLLFFRLVRIAAE